MTADSKFYIFDRRKTFVGSFNLDLRSRHINSELGILLDNAVFSEFLASRFNDVISRVAYKLQLDESNTHKYKQELVWPTEDNGTEVKVGREPNASVWRRMGVWFLSLFPIESQL